MSFYKGCFALVVAMLILMMGSSVGIIWAQENDPESARKQSVSDPDSRVSESKKDDFQKWVFFPVIGSSSETGLLLGGLAVRFIEPSAQDIRTNTIDFLAFGTMEEQYQVIIAPNFYFEDELYHFNLALGGALWPANYYGIGNDTLEDDKEEYDSKAFEANCLFERRIRDGFYAGVNYIIRNEEVDAAANGLLSDDEITGFEGGIQSGLGVAVTWDTRDNLNDARRGSSLELKSGWFRPALGSDFDFDKYELYLRHFVPLTENTGLALGGQINFARGEIPFRELNSPDGSGLLRGIENGRYRDRDMAGLQLEYRFPITGKWGATLFTETAQVAHSIDQLTTDGWKYSFGGGIRYALNPGERFNIRLDLSVVDDGMGVTLNFREAF